LRPDDSHWRSSDGQRVCIRSDCDVVARYQIDVVLQGIDTRYNVLRRSDHGHCCQSRAGQSERNCDDRLRGGDFDSSIIVFKSGKKRIFVDEPSDMLERAEAE
jgi:hypothetical protein